MPRIPDMRRSFDLRRRASGNVETTDVPLGGTRSQSMHRLQIGVGGVVLMVLLVGLASLIQDRTREVDAALVPAAAPTTEPTAASQQSDPLVEAGVVPDLPDNTPPTPAPETGQGVQDVTPNQQ